MNFSAWRPRRTIVPTALAGLVLFACGDGGGPLDLGSGPNLAQLTVSAQIESAAGVPEALQPATLHATVWTADGSSVVKDTTVSVTPGEEVDLTITVEVDQPNQAFLLQLVLRNAQGVEVYRSERTTVIARSPGSVGAPAQITLSYTGPGAGSASLVVTPEEPRVRFGESVTLQATAFAQDGSSLGSVPVDWTTEDPDIVSLADAAAGRWQAQGVRGTARVTATFGPTGLVATARIHVHPAPGGIVVVSGDGQDGSAGSLLDDPVVVVVEGIDGLPLEGEAVAFVPEELALVNPVEAATDANGQASTEWTLGPALGTQTLAATVVSAPELSVMITAEAGPAALARIVLSPEEIAFDAVTATQQVTAEGKDGFDNPFPITDLSWVSSNSAVATVSSQGVVTAVGNGTGNITASAEGVTSSPTVVVVEQVAVDAEITPPSGWEVVVGGLLNFTATALDRLDRQIPGAAFDWLSSRPDVLSISDGGQATGVSVGSASVTARLAADSTIVVSSSGTVVPLTPPTAPSGVTSSPWFPGTGSFAGFRVSWVDESSDETSFRVERSLNGGATWETVDAGVPADAETINDGGPGGWPMDRQVLYRVRACASGSCSEPAVGAVPGLTPPNPPSGLAAAPLGAGEFRVSWVDTNVYESGYQVTVYDRTCSGTVWLGGPFPVGPNVTFLDLGGLSSPDLDFTVQATNDTGSSAEVLLQIGTGPECRLP